MKSFNYLRFKLKGVQDKDFYLKMSTFGVILFNDAVNLLKLNVYTYNSKCM